MKAVEDQTEGRMGRKGHHNPPRTKELFKNGTQQLAVATFHFSPYTGTLNMINIAHTGGVGVFVSVSSCLHSSLQVVVLHTFNGESKGNRTECDGWRGESSIV